MSERRVDEVAQGRSPNSDDDEARKLRRKLRDLEDKITTDELVLYHDQMIGEDLGPRTTSNP